MLAEVGQGHLVDQLVAGAGHPEELGPRDLGQYDLLDETTRFANQDAPGLRQTFDDQRRGHHGIARVMVVEVFFGQRQIFDRPSELPAPELQKFVDPDPAHGKSIRPRK